MAEGARRAAEGDAGDSVLMTLSCAPRSGYPGVARPPPCSRLPFM